MEPEGSLPHSQVPATCPYPEPARSSPYSHIPLPEDILIYSHLRLGLSDVLFFSGFPTKTLYTSLFSLIRATCLVHPILLDFIIRTILGEEYRSLSSSLWSLHQSPITLSLLGPNILHSTLSTWIVRWKGEGKVHPRILHEGPGGNRCRALLFL